VNGERDTLTEAERRQRTTDKRIVAIGGDWANLSRWPYKKALRRIEIAVENAGGRLFDDEWRPEWSVLLHEIADLDFKAWDTRP